MKKEKTKRLKCRTRMPRNRSAVILCEKDKQNKRCNRKVQVKKIIQESLD